MSEVRRADLGDIDALVPLFEAYREFYRRPPAAAAARRFLVERLRNEESIVFIAFSDDGPAVGFALLYPLYSSTRLGRLWLLNDLYVSVAARNQAVGRRLLDRAKRLARDTGAIGLVLETEKNNEVGNHLYPATGFEVDRDHYYYAWANAEWQGET